MQSVHLDHIRQTAQSIEPEPWPPNVLAICHALADDDEILPEMKTIQLQKPMMELLEVPDGWLSV